jgi:hypothetical protein
MLTETQWTQFCAEPRPNLWVPVERPEDAPENVQFVDMRLSDPSDTHDEVLPLLRIMFHSELKVTRFFPVLFYCHISRQIAIVNVWVCM